MKVFKFGGASVKDAKAVSKVLGIIQNNYPLDDLCVVFSAMGKTTNALEKVAEAWYARNKSSHQLLKGIEKYHLEITGELNISSNALLKRIKELNTLLRTEPPATFDEAYDIVVSFGELFSTDVMGSYITFASTIDARELVVTDNTHRNGSVNWALTQMKIQKGVKNATNVKKSGRLVIITQGFIGSTIDGKPVTLGREGSDFSAAIFAWALNAEEMIIWKDVPGVLNADPRYFNDTVKLDKMSYRDAIELAYYGASVIHPKTIQPLQSSQIPLYVNPFNEPGQSGTLIYDFEDGDHGDQIPSFIIKHDQVLMSISPRDFSFIAEGNLHGIFGSLSQFGIHINMMQLSAISFSIVIDNLSDKLEDLLKNLKEDYRIRYNSGLELITIRYYDQQTIDKIVGSRKVLLEQKSRTTVQLVVNS